MNTDIKHGFAIMPPTGFDDDFKASDSWAVTEKDAWIRFCHPALRREGYEADGFKAVPCDIIFSLAAAPRADEGVMRLTARMGGVVATTDEGTFVEFIVPKSEMPPEPPLYKDGLLTFLYEK